MMAFKTVIPSVGRGLNTEKEALPPAVILRRQNSSAFWKLLLHPLVLLTCLKFSRTERFILSSWPCSRRLR